MRMTVNLPDDVHQIARLYAREHNLTFGEAIGELVRKGAEADRVPSDFWKDVKFVPKRPGQPKVTPEDIYSLLDEEE